MRSSAFSRIVLTVVVFGALATQAAGGKWGDDFEKAKKEAAEKGVPILIDFSGSDWCGWCVRLEKEVFSKSSFKKYARKNLVLFLADFPRRKKVDKDTKKQNDELMKKYGVRGFPTVVLVDAEGKELGRTGYKEGGPKVYVEHLKELLKDFKAPEAAEAAEAKDKKDK